MIISQAKDFDSIVDNKIIGTAQLLNSKLIFNGKNNIVFFEEGVILENSCIIFNGNNSLVYLSKSSSSYKVSIMIHNDSACYFGGSTYFGGVINISLSERKNVIFGSNLLISTGISVRTADPHLIFDCSSYKRVNPSKSVFVGDHVWVGQDALLLKGTRIGSGSIVGARAVVQKEIPSNSTCGGVAAKVIKEGIFWDGSVVHNYSAEDTNTSLDYNLFAMKYRNGDRDIFKFKYDDSSLSFDDIDHDLEECSSSDDRLNYLFSISKSKNRFAIKNK